MSVFFFSSIGTYDWAVNTRIGTLSEGLCGQNAQFLAYFPNFEYILLGLLDLNTVSHVCVSPISKQIFMKLGMYIMALEPISTAYFMNHSYQSVCLRMCISVSLLRNGSVIKLPRQWIHTQNNRRIVERVVSYAVGVV
jgi:hypothetical protein